MWPGLRCGDVAVADAFHDRVVMGPDGARYWYAGAGGRVPRPFHLRWLLPFVCRNDERRWWLVWAAGWVTAAVGMFGWVTAAGGGWRVGVAAVVLLLGLPGFLGPGVTIPVGVDVPATGVGLCAVALLEAGQPVAGLVVLVVAASIRETVPVFAALWVWSWVPLLGLLVPLLVHVLVRQGRDPLGERFQHIADHPVKAGLMFHRGRWRDGWLLVAPWGVCLLGLGAPSWQMVVVLVVAYGQLLIATDTVRLYSHAAGPVLAFAAADIIPTQWLLLACVVHVVWFRQPERV